MSCPRVHHDYLEEVDSDTESWAPELTLNDDTLTGSYKSTILKSIFYLSELSDANSKKEQLLD